MRKIPQPPHRQAGEETLALSPKAHTQPLLCTCLACHFTDERQLTAHRALPQCTGVVLGSQEESSCPCSGSPCFYHRGMYKRLSFLQSTQALAGRPRNFCRAATYCTTPLPSCFLETTSELSSQRRFAGPVGRCTASVSPAEM